MQTCATVNRITEPQPTATPIWPTSEFYVSETHRLVYCPIQKVACSSLKLWWAQIVDGSSEPFTFTNQWGQFCIDHYKLDTTYKLKFQTQRTGRLPVMDDSWFRIAFVRNPWARLVSTFVNKFVQLHALIQPVFDAMDVKKRAARRQATPINRVRQWVCDDRRQWRDKFTFRHFVDYLSDRELAHVSVDPHWRAQYSFLGEVPFHFIGRFERLEDDFRVLASRVGAKIDLPAVNRTAYEGRQPVERVFADTCLSDLRNLKAMPDYRSFYTPELAARVADLYRTDVERFGYEFEN